MTITPIAETAAMRSQRRAVAEAAGRHGDVRADGRARALLSILYLTWNRFAQAEDELRTARARCAAAGDTLVLAYVTKWSGLVAAQRGRHEEAVADYAEALATYRAAGDREAEAGVLTAQAAVLGDLARYPEALQAGNAGRRLYRELVGHWDVPAAEQPSHLGAPTPAT